MPFVYSTLANNQKYTLWAKGGSDVPVEIGHVIVRGGTGVIQTVRGHADETPVGVRTEITDEQLAMLEQIPQFREHRERGYISVENRKFDPEKIAGKLEGDDKSQQLNDMSLKAMAGGATESDRISVGAPQ